MPKFEFTSNLRGKQLPKRSTKGSAGYDFFAPCDFIIPSGWTHLWNFIRKRAVVPAMVPTGVKAKMASNEALFLYNRSSNPGRGLVMANGVGVIDSDYYNNESNEGEICFMFYNLMPWSVKIEEGQKIGQGVFTLFRKTSDDEATATRKGGVGSTGK